MLKKSMLAALSLATLAVGAPAAHAGPATAVCGGVGIISEGGTVTATVYGYAAFEDQRSHTFDCYLVVNGMSFYGPTGSGSSILVATYGPGSFTMPAGDVTECAEVDGTTVECHELPIVDNPFTSDLTVDEILCPLLASLSPGVPGVVDITPEGDVYVVSLGRVYDCPPYH